MDHHAESTIDDRARRSARLSLVAGVVHAGIFVLLLFASPSERTWLIRIGIPPLVFSVAAAVQYRKTSFRGMGAAAALVYWLFAVTYFLAGGLVFIPGALLQTAAWFVSRKSRESRDAAKDSRIV